MHDDQEDRDPDEQGDMGRHPHHHHNHHPADHHRDHDDDGLSYVGEDGVRRDGLWFADTVELRSVGIDVGSSGTQVLFSRLLLRRQGLDLSSRYAVVQRELLYRSPVELTPYLDEHRIDAVGVARIVEQAYRKSNFEAGTIDTGVVILTGEAIRRENARALADSLALWSGQFVTVTAGHHMEAVLAAHGSGTVTRSYEYGMRILNVDIGGGTTKLAVVDHGQVLATGALYLGGRLVAFDDEWRVTRLESGGVAIARAAGVHVGLGERISVDDCQRLAKWMAKAIIEATRRSAVDDHELFWLTDPVPGLESVEGIIVSGGVGEYVYGNEQRKFGDLGWYFGQCLRDLLNHNDVPLLPAAECIRATAIGASEYTVQISGNTLAISAPERLPLRNVTVLMPRYTFCEAANGDDLVQAFLEALSRLENPDDEAPVALALHFDGDPSYERLRMMAEALSLALRPLKRAVILVFDTDVAQNVGAILREELGFPWWLAVIDGVDLREFDFIDLGRVIQPQGVVPVTIKSLVFSGIR